MFTTQVNIPKFKFNIDHSQHGLILGSCFAQEIGAKFAEAKLPITCNPHGVLFNAASIGHTFHDFISQRRYSIDDLVNHQDIWHSMHHHGSFSNPNPQTVLDNINTNIKPRFDYIIVTLGSAWVYEFKGQIVANCHKLPASEFNRCRLSVEQCVTALTEIAGSGVPVIVTVSPVRHIKDGLAENSLSKAILRLAAAQLEHQYDNVQYFPSFEIVMDELRDYRYYADDMLHPSRVAIDYIWKQFSESVFTSKTRHIITEISKLNAAINHRPNHVDSSENYAFQSWISKEKERLLVTYGIDY